MKRTLALGLVALTFAACAAPAACPTPEPVVQPTPQVITKEVPVPGPVVEVTPQACRDLITYLVDNGQVTTQFTIDTLASYLDYPNENLAEFGQRVERLLNDLDLPEMPDNIDTLITQCLGAATSGDGQNG